jgi:hypothetical protein
MNQILRDLVRKVCFEIDDTASPGTAQQVMGARNFFRGFEL